MKLFVATLVLALGLSACGEPAREAQQAETPVFEAVSIDGGEVSLASLRGEAVLLNVWATWCAPCREEIPYLAELHATEGANGLRVIGVSIDAARDRGKVAEQAPQLGITYDIWLDPEERIAGVMRYAGVPASMLLDRDGVVRWKHVGVLRATTPGFSEALGDVLKAE
jgi:cytochrome c biogenesis protein CcmG/thiol:disulfide interchange protein DsbE